VVNHYSRSHMTYNVFGGRLYLHWSSLYPAKASNKAGQNFTNWWNSWFLKQT